MQSWIGRSEAPVWGLCCRISWISWRTGIWPTHRCLRGTGGSPADSLRNVSKNLLLHLSGQSQVVAKCRSEKKGEELVEWGTPEFIEQYCFSPLAMDVIQVSRHLGCWGQGGGDVQQL